MKLLEKGDRDFSGKQVRFAGDGESKIMSFEQAVQISEQFELDLVLVSPQANPPVVKMIDYGKEMYAKQKKEKANQTKTKVKEVKFHVNIDTNDYKTKINNIKRFLNKKCKVKVTIELRGREMAHKNLRSELLENILSDLEEIGKIENPPKEAGRKLSLLMGAV